MSGHLGEVVLSDAARSIKENRAAAGGAAWENRRSEIIGIAVQLFDRYGYAHTSMDQIAYAASLGKASLYHYCDSKSDLLVQIHNDFMDLLFKKLDDIERQNLPPQEQLKAVVFHIVSLADTHGPYLRTYLEHYREAPMRDRRVIGARRRRYEEVVGKMVTDAIDLGIFREIDPSFATMTIFGSANWTYQWYGRLGGDPVKTAEAMWDVLFHGLSSD
jgi:TetR/AcrR family transcriptional regulator, cholesterol catabolism regulator